MCYTPDIFNNIFRWQFFLERDISMWAQAYNNNTLLLAAIRYNKMNCELMLTYDTPAYMFNVYKNQPTNHFMHKSSVYKEKMINIESE